MRTITKVVVSAASAAQSAGVGSGGRGTAVLHQKMNILAKWNPFRELDEVQNRLSSFLGRSPGLRGADETMAMTEWAPSVDIIEDDNEYLIKAELPEVKREDVKVTAEEGTLRIFGERKLEKEESGRKYHRMECSYGSFERCFTLPEGTKTDALTAEFKDGVLKVHLPKTEIAKPKSVEVKVE